MADIQEWFVEHEVRSFYSRVDLRLPHRRSGREPHHPARVHARQRLHLRRELPRPRAGHRRLRPQPLVLLLQRHGPRVRGARPGGPAHLGRRHARPLRRRRAQPEAQVPRADLGPVAARAGDGLQRHPHHAPGAHRDLRQRQQPPHQRLRRGRHHPDRRVGAAGAGHPADHQPRVGPLDEREPQPGQLRHRAAHRPRRGGGARRARADLRAGRRARRHGDRLPAGPHPGRVDALRARASTTARCRSSASTRSSPPTATPSATTPSSSCARSTDEEKQSQLTRLARLPGAPRRRAPADARAPPRRRPRRRQPVRRADGRGARAAASARSPTPCSRSAAATAATSRHTPGGTCTAS